MAEILHETTETLPGSYVFDVVTSNFKALERVSRSEYRLVCFAEDTSSALDGHTAATVLRRVRTGMRRKCDRGRAEGGGGRMVYIQARRKVRNVDFPNPCKPATTFDVLTHKKKFVLHPAGGNGSRSKWGVREYTGE